MSTVWRTSIRATICVAVLGSILVLQAGGAAAQAGPTIAITPSSVSPGGTVGVDLAGFPDPGGSDTWYIGVCIRGWQDFIERDFGPLGACGVLATGTGAFPSHRDLVVPDGFAPPEPVGSRWRCTRPVPDTCEIAAFRDTGLDAVDYTATPIHVIPNPWVVTTDLDAVTGGTTVRVATTGFPAGPGAIGLCPLTTQPTDAAIECEALVRHAGGLPTSSNVEVVSTYRSAGAEVECSPECRLAAWVLDDDGMVIAYDYVVMRIGPAPLSITPGVAVSDPQPFRLVQRGLVPGPYLVAQCAAWGRVSDANWCGVPVTTTVGADRVLDATITASSAFTTRDGTDYTCERNCYLLVATATGRDVSGGYVAFGPPGISLPASMFEDHQDIWTGVWGFQSSTATVAECALPLGADLSSSRCGTANRGISTLTSNGYSDVAVHLDAVFSYGGGTVDCHVVPCVLGAFDDQDRLVVASDRLAFRNPLVMTMTPTTGLADGRPMRIRVQGLEPTARYQLVRCVAGSEPVRERCAATERPFPVRADAAGVISASRKARQRFVDQTGRARYCRDRCTIELAQRGEQGVLTSVAATPYSMASPSVSAVPATALHDGSTVRVNASGLQPSYVGPRIFLPTGGWAVVQCDRAVGSDPTLVELLIHCGTATGGGAIDVRGSTSSTDMQVQATLAKVLGGTTDCTTSAGACVVGLARWEQDATVSSTFTPISFG